MWHAAIDLNPKNCGIWKKIEDTSTLFEQLEDDRYNLEDTWECCEVGHEAWKSSAADLEQKAEKGEILPVQKAQNGEISPYDLSGRDDCRR
jgi:hypothetical protein